MKKTILMLFMGLSIMAQAQQKLKDKFSLAGTVLEQKEGLIYLRYYDSNEKFITDSTHLTGGRFSFTGRIKTPTKALISNQNSVSTVFLEPVAMSGTFPTDDFPKAAIRGSKTQDLFADLERKRTAIATKYQEEFDLLKGERNKKKLML